MANNFFEQLSNMGESLDRTIEVLGVPYVNPFNEEAIIADVSDPKSLGRVKVTTADGLISDWIPVSGSSRGRLSSKYIGTRVLLVKVDGRPENLYVTGILSGDSSIGVIGTPVQLPIIDESVAVWSGSSDTGMQCNEGNEGRMYVLSNEIGQDVVVCLKRSSPQTGSQPVWAWKSMTNGLWVEKGFNPGNETTPSVTQSQANNPGIPECNEAMLGERHDFSEDRGFRTMSIQCRRNENKGYSWVPENSSPVFFRTTLPNCSESVHGMSAALDDGNNSEFLVCQRYQGKMKWVRQGRRIPHKFHSKDKPLTRIEFLERFNSITGLEQKVSISGYDWAEEAEVYTAVFDELFSSIPLTGTDPELKNLLELANLIPSSAFDQASTLKKLANAAIKAKTGIPAEEIVNTIRIELDEGGKLTDTTATILTGVGKAAEVLVNGAKAGTEEDALIEIGRETLVRGVTSLSPEAGSVMTGLMTGGVWGAIDSSVAIGLDKLPDEVSRYVGPVVDLAKDLLKGQPVGVSDIVNAAMRGGLSSKISSFINSAVGSGLVSSFQVESVARSLVSGAFGDISKVFGGLGNLSSIAKLPPPADSIPLTASSALGLVNQAQTALNFFGNGGIGLEPVQSLLGNNLNPSAIIASGVAGLSGLLAGKSDCPCGEKCRKTFHGKDSDGNNILAPCGSMSSNNANSYNGSGVPVPNNVGPIAQELGLEFTKLGSNLLPSNLLDLTDIVKKVPRVNKMAETYYGSRFADQTEKELETASSFEATEKALKIADNNITRVESIERKLIDSVYNILLSVVYNKNPKSLSTLDELLTAVRNNSLAIKDVYNFVKKLDGVKNGGSAGVRITNSINSAFNNISNLTSLSERNKKNALKILAGGVVPADAEWRGLNPDLSRNTKLGEYSPTLPTPFPNEKTIFDEARVLSESLESKLDDNNPEQKSLFNTVLSENQVESLKNSQTSTGKSLYDDVLDRNGKTNCYE
jgi:hypothetical protein